MQIPAHTNYPAILKILCGCGSHPVPEQNSARGLNGAIKEIGNRQDFKQRYFVSHV